MKDKLILISGNSNPQLAKKIASYLKLSLSSAEVKQFPDGEIFVKINENVRGTDVFVIQPTCDPVNVNFMELLIMVDALKRASARRITTVIPYYCYARQDRKGESRVPITAKLIADLITTAGANRVLTMDLHVGQIQGFFNVPVDHLYAAPVFIDYFKKKKLRNLTVVAPDAGRVNYSRFYAEKLNVSLAIIDKRRVQQSHSEVINIVGEVRRKNIIIFDDIIDTAGTITAAADILKKHEANDIYIGATHAVFSNPALTNIEKAAIKEVVVTDTIPLKNNQCKKIKVISVSSILAEAIFRIHKETSVSSLFN